MFPTSENCQGLMITPRNHNLRPIFHFHLCSLTETKIFKSKRFLSYLRNTGEKIKKIDNKRKNKSIQRGLFTTKISPEIGLLEIIHHAHWVKKEPSVIAGLFWKISTFPQLLNPRKYSHLIQQPGNVGDGTAEQRESGGGGRSRCPRRKRKRGKLRVETRVAGWGGGRGNYKNKSRRACSENKV